MMNFRPRGDKIKGSNASSGDFIMLARFTLLTAFFLAASIPLTLAIAGPDQPKADLKAKVAKLIKQLDDNDSVKRTEAETELIKLGADILPLLPEKEEGLSAEQKRRLASVRATLKGA